MTPDRGDSATPRWIYAIPVAAFIVGIVGLFWWMFGWGPPETRGDIYVDTPEVYTRERLVNDRFRQEAWLTGQLRRTDTLMEDGAFAGVEARLARRDIAQAIARVKGGIGQNSAGMARGEGGSAGMAGGEQDGGNADGRIPRPDRVDLTPNPINQFRDAQTYRDVIRTELMRTQLDDRHDIEGNTLYRLDFDATISPGDNTAALATIVVIVQEVEEQQRLPVYEEVYDRLHKDLQAAIDGAIENQINVYASGQEYLFRGPEMASFQEYIDYRLCVRVSDFIGYPDLSKQQPGKFRKDPEARCDQSKYAEFMHAFQKYTQDRELISWFNELQSKLPEDHKIEPLEEIKRSGSLSPPLQEAERRLLDEVRDYAVERCGDPLRFRRLENKLTCVPRYPHNKMNDRIALLANLENRHRAHPVDLGKTSAVEVEEYVFTFRGIYPARDPEYMRQLLSDFMLSKLNNETRQYQVGRPIGEMFDAEVGGCEVGQCTIRLGLRKNEKSSSFSEQRTSGAAARRDEADGFWRGLLALLGWAETDEGRTACSGETKWADYGTICVLERTLNDGARAFSYAVMPAEWTQALATEDLTRGSLHAALEAAAAVSDRAVEATLEGLNEFERQIETRYRSPVVIGFGDPSGDEDRTRFGWVIRPQITPQLNGGQQPQRQNARTYPLSAVVSVPSWWRLLKVEVRTSWIDGRRLLSSRSALAATQERCKAPDCRIHYVRVPGSVKEIREKLKYEVRDEPYIDFKATALGQTLEIGRPGQLVIEGGRLWRSTVVRMGNQQADNITVLPNMKGIIAEFSCVHPPPGAPEDPPGAREAPPAQANVSPTPGEAEVSSASERPDEIPPPGKGQTTGGRGSTSGQTSDAWKQQDVHVWTSEGRTAEALPVSLQPFNSRAAGDRGLIPCYLTKEKEDPIFAAPQSDDAASQSERTPP